MFCFSWTFDGSPTPASWLGKRLEPPPLLGLLSARILTRFALKGILSIRLSIEAYFSIYSCKVLLMALYVSLSGEAISFIKSDDFPGSVFRGEKYEAREWRRNQRV